MTAVPRLASWRSPTAAFVALGVLGGGILGAASAYSATFGVAALGGVLLLVAIFSRPANLAVIALLGVFAVQRVGSSSFAPGSQGGISYSDALLTVAAFLALPALIGTPELRRLRVPLLGLGAYLSCLLPTVILNFSTRGYLEWTHRLVLVGGSLLVGAWIAREGLTRLALRWLTLVACLVAVLAVENSIRRGFAAASPLGLNKNYVGAVLGAVIVVVAIGAKYLELGHRRQIAVVLVLAGGLLASHSRGGILAAATGLLVAVLFDPRGHSRRVRAFSVLVALLLAAVAAVSIHDQLNQTREDRINGSIGVRFNVEKVTRDVWRTSPVAGVGLKYFNSGEFGRFAQPANNDVDNELAESGIIGLLGFMALQGAVMAGGARRRRGGPIVAAAVGVVAGELLHGMVDIYWTGGAVTLPFVVMGIALATRAADETEGSSSVSPARAVSSQ